MNYLFFSALAIISITILPSAFAENTPDWIKITAEWWVSDSISENEFLNAIEFLNEKKLIKINTSHSSQLYSEVPDWLFNNAGWWAARIFTDSVYEFNFEYLDQRIMPCNEHSHSDCQASQPKNARTFNSYGLRGEELQKEKPDDVFRIITLGGSTTFGTGVRDNETWPSHLQEIINSHILDKKIEVINAGLPGYHAKMEYELLKNKLLSFEPDLVIMFDGYNDYVKVRSIEETISSWNLVCLLGKNNEFDTVIFIQPLASPTQRVFTEQEQVHRAIWGYQQQIQEYLEKSTSSHVDDMELTFEGIQIDYHCSEIIDLTKIFDYIQQPIYYDEGHTLNLGNKIIAKNIFSYISSLYLDTDYSFEKNNTMNNSESVSVSVYAVGSNFTKRNFDNMDLNYGIFNRADLSNASFNNANLVNARFMFADLSNVDLSNQNLKNTTLIGANLSNSNLSYASLTNSTLIYANLSHATLTGLDLSGLNLTGVNLSESNLSGKNMNGITLHRANLTNANLTQSDLSFSDLRRVNFAGADLLGVNLNGANLEHANLHSLERNELQLKELLLLSGSNLNCKNHIICEPKS